MAHSKFRVCHIRSGFTILELLIVIGILSLITGTTAITSMDSYRRSLSQADARLISGVLRHARNLSMNRACSVVPCTDIPAHGVFIEAHQLTLFEGDSYIARVTDADEVFSFAGSEEVLTTGEILFTAISGDTPSEEAIIIPNIQGPGWVITVTTAGGIVLDSIDS